MKNLSRYDESLSVPRKEDVIKKQDTVVGGASTITEDNLTASRALVSNSSGKVAVSNVTSTELGYLDGVTSNVQAQLNRKLETVHDNDILWGGKNLSGEVSPTDAAMVSTIGGNKFALCKPQGITVEYTNDGGATWINYDTTEATKINVLSGISNANLYYGNKTESSQIVTADDMLRITVNAFACGVYTSLRKILIEFAAGGSINDFVQIESATIGDQEAFTVVGTYSLIGNSAWNSIPYSTNFGAYSLAQTSNVGVLRFTFSTNTASSYKGRPSVKNLILNGITNYVNPSKLSATGHLYSYDYKQNATFPANVTANQFIGNGSKLTNIPYPVTSVNGATGEVKSTFYVAVTQGNGNHATADKTAAEVYAAYEAGYAVYAIAKFTGAKVPYTLPLLAAVSVSGTVVLGFATIGSNNADVNPQGLVVLYNGAAWSAWSDTLAKIQDIPTIPTELKNPYSLVIKIGNETTAYDGSAAKNVEIPRDVPVVTAADNGKFLRVVNGAWAAAAIDNANGGSF